jgi:hypothetical protein
LLQTASVIGKTFSEVLLTRVVALQFVGLNVKCGRSLTDRKRHNCRSVRACAGSGNRYE